MVTKMNGSFWVEAETEEDAMDLIWQAIRDTPEIRNAQWKPVG